MGKQFRLTMPVVPEHSVQAQLCRILTMELAPPGKLSRDGVVWYAIDHANYAGEIPGVRIARGIVAGILDMFLLWNGHAYFVELKTEDGRLSPEQQSVAAAVLGGGGRVGVVATAEQLLAVLDSWGIPRRRRVRVAA